MTEPLDRDNEYVMYIVARTSLGLSPGKLAAQAGHAVERVLMGCSRGPSEERRAAIETWRQQASTKILLSADEKEFARVKEIPGAFVVVDLGRTEIAANTETVIGLCPMRRGERPSFLKRMRVLT